MCIVSSTAQRFQGMGLVAVGFLAMVLTTGSWHLARRGSGPTQRAFGAVAALLTGMSAAQFLTAAYGEGIETTKHMVIALMAGAFAVYTLVIALVAEEPPSAGRTPDETRGSTVDRHAAHGRP